MMKKIEYWCLFVCFSMSSFLVPLVAPQNVTVCSEAGNETCANDGNRVCLQPIDTGNFTCGNCQNGYIEFRDNCYDIDAINFTFVLDLIEEFQPRLTAAAGAATDELRIQRLETLARVVSEYQSRIPPLPFELGLNRYSVDTPEERRQLLGTRAAENIDGEALPSFDTTADISLSEAAEERRKFRRFLQNTRSNPPSVDWEAAGAMTDVKDQERCGCCWAVSTTAAIEAAAYLTRNSSGFKQSLSFQQMISCDEENNGCNGGNTLYSMRYAWKNKEYPDQGVGGLATLNDWPFSDGNGQTTQECNPENRNASVFLKEPQAVVTADDKMSFEERRDSLKKAVSIQPVTIILKSDCDLFMSYKGGVMTDDGSCACGVVQCIDHAVVMVGYDDTADPPYWKLRNSWGTRWGEDGYFRIASEPQGAGEWGLFGMLAEATIPLYAYNVTAAEPDNEDGLDQWVKILLIVLGVLIGICCLMAVCQKVRSKE